tara:strand:+ start:38572 stop:39006 length:435 start_codon:yes stop_codon:yes gene_type:complete
MEDIHVRSPKNNEWEEYFTVRYKTLREPWGQPKGSEKDSEEDSAVHAAAFYNNKIIGVARLQKAEGTKGQIRYMGVLSSFEGKGVGSKLLKYLETKAKELGIETIILNARENALPFYRKNGYETFEKSYLLWGEIQHYLMQKSL